MKKIFILIATLFLGITLISCQKKEFTVHIFVYKGSDPYLSALGTAAKKHLEEKNIKYEFYDANGSQSTQNAQIDTAITKKADIIAVNMVEAMTLETIYNKTSKAKIPLISFNRQPDDIEFMKNKKDIVLLNAKKDEAGKLMAKMVFDYISQDYDKYLKTDGKTLKYIYVHGTRSMPAAVDGAIQTKAELKRLLNAAGKNDPVFANGVLTDIDSEWQAANAKIGMDTLFTKADFDIDKVDAIICCNDDSAFGILQSLQIRGYNKGYNQDGTLPKNTIPLFGLDALPAGRTAIKEGKLTGSILQDYTESARLIAAAAENVKENKGYILNKTADNIITNETNGFIEVLIEFKIYDPKIHGE